MNIFKKLDPLIDYSKIKLIIFDVDGTLYNQRKLRISMLFRICIYILNNPNKLYEISLIIQFRKLFEDYDKLLKNINTNDCIDVAIYKQVSEKYKLDIMVVREVVYKWLYNIPLKYVKKFKYDGINELFDKISKNNINIAVYSDYPSKEKLKILDLSSDIVVASIDKEINELKPSPKALLYIIKHFGVSPSRCLLIGDRDDRDGECARSANISFIKV